MHIVDLAWAAIAGLALIYPLWRLVPHINRPGIRDLALVLGILGLYPALLAVFHLTPFDLGLVYSVTTFLPALYFFLMTGYVGLKLHKALAWRYTLFCGSGILAVLALTNVWHGMFAEFESHVPGRPNHMLDDLRPGMGMGAMHALAVVLVLSAIILSMIQFARARLRPAQLLLAVVLPALALLSFTSTVRWSLLADAGVSGFILTTSLLLLVANYALMRNHFLEVRVVTRSRLMHLLPDAMLLLSRRGRILDANPAFAKLVGRPLGELIDENISDYIDQIGSAVTEGSPDSFDLDLSSSDTPLYLRGSVASADSAIEAGQYLVVLRDVTDSELIKAELLSRDRQLQDVNTALRELSVTDTLTGLPNRRAFRQEIEQAVALFKSDGRRFTLLLLDVDRFKSVNDRHGHATGDQALCHVAHALRSQCRASDSLARYGGEEFVVLLDDIGEGQITHAAERFRLAVESTPFILACTEKLSLTVSIGGASWGEAMSIEDLLKAADGALYEAKHSGRNRVCIR